MTSVYTVRRLSGMDANTTHQPQRSDHELAAYQLGVNDAISAASWIVDGNTKTEIIPSVLALMDDGDPLADEYLPRRPDLSGEWADERTPLTLVEEITGQTCVTDEDEDLVCGLADAYEEGVSDTFETECERILRAAIA